MISTKNRNRKRLVIFFLIVIALATVLTFRVGWVQIVNGEKYSAAATEQQTLDTPISAKRGVIYDRNGEELAVSATTNTIWVFPSRLATGETDEEKQQKVEDATEKLAKILEMEDDEVAKIITKDQSIVKLAKYVDEDKANAIRESGVAGISIAEDTKRYYPLGAFAACVLGSTTDDNQGLSGIELKYNQYLSGTAGRWITSSDVNDSSLSYGVEKYYQAEDGLSVILTIDSVVQHYVEKSIDEVMNNTGAKRVMCLVMEPKTGEVLAMANTPDYDLNDPRKPLKESEQKLLEALDDTKKMEYWNAMWRNPLVSDTYEPGSTFKLLTTASALEEGVTRPTEMFHCTGYYKVADRTLKCWRYYNPHGTENLAQAVQNSCNPVFIQLASRMGVTKFYDYLERFGLMEKTGIDFPGEGGNLLQSESVVGPVELATISYGQGIAVTPISLLTAICSLGNDGYMMQPHLVRELRDSNGNTVEKYDPSVVRQVVSKETAAEMCVIMESVVAEGGGGAAKIAGYRIGGKTGTANKAENGGYSTDTYSSFVGMVPMDDPQLAILLVVDSPQGVKFGSVVAAPGVKAILEDTLRYLKIEPEYTAEEKAAIKSTMVTVPDFTGEGCSQAAGVLAGLGLTFEVEGTVTNVEETDIIQDQYPKAGTEVQKGSAVYLYLNQ